MVPVSLTLPAFVAIGAAAAPVPISAGGSGRAQSHRYRNDVRGGPGVLKYGLPVEAPNGRDVPEHFDWRSIEGRSYVVPTYNQYVPGECGSCWAHASAAALSDRVKRLRNASFPDIEVSRQVLLNCLSGWDGPRNGCCTCDGGDPYQAYKYIYEHGIPDETCAAYVAAVQSCSAAHVCRGVDGSARREYPKYYISEFGAYLCGNATTKDQADYNFQVPRCQDEGPQAIARMEQAMQSEIYARGPIPCCMAVTDAFLDLGSHEVFVEPSSRYHCDHVVSVSGWGQTPLGQKYWIVRNSFGSFWGEHGWFRIQRGTNNAGIEEYCAWAVPRDDWSSTTLEPLGVTGLELLV